MENKKRSPKRNKRTGGKVVGGAVLLAVLLAGGHFGLGIGRADGGFIHSDTYREGKEIVTENAKAAKEVTSEYLEKKAEEAKEDLNEAAEKVRETVTEAVTPQDDGVLTILVREDKLLYEGREVTIEQLEEALLRDYKAGSSTLELKDDHAIKAAYDEVKTLLQKLSLPYTEGK